MICIGVDGMKRVLFKVIIPLSVTGLWLITCYPVCRKADGFDWFLYWILAGFPFDIRRMYLWLIPKNFGISGTIGVLALDCIVGGLIGGVVLIVKVIRAIWELVSIITGNFWTKSPKVGAVGTWLLLLVMEVQMELWIAVLLWCACWLPFYGMIVAADRSDTKMQDIWKGRTMESLRDVDRVMQREIKKGSTPLQFENVKFGNDSCHVIASQEKLIQVLSYLLRVGEYEAFAGKTIGNNVYMDMRGKQAVFKRARLPYERKNIFATIKRLAKKYKPDYDGKVYLETVRCLFTMSEEELEKCRYNYQGRDTYAFPMSEKYIMGLYIHCLSARKALAMENNEPEGLSNTEVSMVKLESVREVLFQALLLDDVKFEDGKMYAELCTVLLTR